MKTLHTIYNNFAKRNLVSLRLLLVMLLTLTVSANAWGAEYTIIFKSASSDSNTDLGATPNVSNVVSSGTDYVASFSECSKMYVGTSGIKLGSSKAAGTMNFTLATNYQSNIKSIKVVSAKYGSDSGTLTLYSGSTSLKSGITPGTDYTHKFSSPTKVTSLKLVTSSKRAYITKIVITTEETATCTTNPNVSVGSYSSVTSTTATVSCSGGITSLGSAGCSITSYGFVYGTSSNPTISNTKVQVGTTYTTTGTSFSKGLTGLTANTTYYVRPYATNGNGTAYGTQTSFKTLELPKYTVTLKDDNSTLTQSSAGGSVTLPSRADCTGYTFAGWTKTWTEEQEEWTTTAPAIIPTGSYTPTANESLYPVYTKTEGGSSTPTNVTKVYSGANDADLKFSTGSSSNNLVNNDGYTAGNVNVKFTTGTNSNNSYYDGSVVRFYAGSSLIVTPLNDVTITQVEFVRSTSSSSSSNTGTISTDQLTASQSNSTTNTNVFTGSATSAVTFKNSAQCRFSVLRITYITSGGSSTTSYISVPDCDPCASLQAPTVTATDITHNSITLSWEVVDGATSYNVYNYTTEDAEETTDLTYAFSGLNPETEYQWEVEAVSATCNGKGTKGSTNTPAPPALTNYRTFCEVVCDAYSFHTGSDDDRKTWAKEAIKCFAQLGSTTEWQIKDYIIPADEKFFVGKYGYFYNDNLGTNNSRSLVKTWTEEMYIAPAMDSEDGPGSPKLGKAVGAKGTLRIFDDSEWNNLYVGFIPDSYKLKFGTTEHAFALHNEDDHEWRSEEVVEYNSTTAAYNVSVGVVDASGKYVATDHTQEMRHIFLDVTSWGGDGNYGLYDITNETFTCLMHKTGYPNIYEGWVPASCQKVIFVRLSNSTPSWDNKWNQTGDLTLSNDKNLFTITQWDNQTTGWSAYERYGQFAMHDNSKSKNWYVHFVPHYVLTYDKNANDATGEMDVRTIVVDAPNKNVVLEDCGFTRPGYRFVKWQKDNTSTYYVPNGSNTIELNADITLYAQWEKEYTVTYNANGGTTTCEDNNAYAKGETVTVCATPPTRAGHTFLGWSDGTNTYSAGATFNMPASNVTLTAQWQINTYTVTLNPNYPAGKTGIFTDKEGNPVSGNLVLTYNYNTASKTLTELYNTLELDGYQFNGWFSATSGGSEWEKTGIITKDITLFAQWTQRHTVTWMVNGEELDLDATYTSCLHNEKVNKLPPAPESRCGKVFVGWTMETIDLETNTPPAVLFKESDASPNVTADVTYRAVWADEEVGAGSDGWVLTDIANIDSDDAVVITMTTNNGVSYALPNNGGTSTPVANKINITDNKLSSNPASIILWNISNSSGNLTIYPDGTTATWLYCTNDNDGVRVGKGTNKTFTITSGYLKNTGQNRYVGVYTDKPDWRCYTSTSTNIGGQTLGFYTYQTSTTHSGYTTSPVCAPVIEITEGKDIYVTGGNAGGTRDRVIAQQKVKFSATYLKAGLTGQKPDVKVWAADITIGGVATTKVEIDNITQNLTLQTDGTYAGTGEITITYKPTEFDVEEDVNVQLSADYNTGSDVLFDNFTVHARSLPAEFVIVAKSGDKWYALNGDMSDSKAQPANGQVTLDDAANPTKATFAPCNAVYTFDGMPNTGDRTFVRFQGTDGAWLWSSSGTNTGIQNNVLAQNPTGDNKAYNWKLTTTDNVTYQFSNANNNRNLRLNAEKFGMYTSGVQDIRILPIEAKCIYNYAPTNLKVSVLKGTSATLTWDEVSGATKYQYSTDATNWTDAGAAATVTINGLTETTDYTYYVRAYHEDADITQECIDYATVTFTTAACDDVPTNITYSADQTRMTITWVAESKNCTVRLYSDEACEEEDQIKFADGLNGSVTFSQLDRNTTYYVKVFADGTCASEVVEVKTEDVKMDIVEWKPDGIVVDINTNEKVKVTLENEVSFGSGTGTVAEDLFFSKYFEANGNAKILAVYNGTNEKIDLSAIRIINKLGSGDLSLASFGHKEAGYIYPGEEIILYNKGTDAVNACSEEQKTYPDWYNVEDNALMFGGRATLLLKRGNEIIDIIGAMDSSDVYNIPKAGYNNETEKPSWGDDPGWVCTNGDNIETTEVEDDYSLSTNRCLLVRKNTVVSGDNAIEKNINKVFATLCEEWVGLQIPKNAPSVDDGETESCEGMAFVGDFDYSNYYTKYVSMNQDQVFEANVRNEDGTLTIPITDLNKQSCRNIKITIKDASDKDLKTQTYKVPIMITSDQTTAGQAFLALQENLATVEIDGSGNPTGNKTNLTLDEVREICKTCDVVIRDDATLTKVATGTANDHPQVNNVYIYEGASLVVPDGNYTYNVNGLSLRRREDQVPSLSVQGGEELQVNAASIYLDVRVNAHNWHWFTLPYDCDIADVTWVDGTPAKYGVDWFLSTYNGEKRAAIQSADCWEEYHGTTIEKGKGYILGVMGDIQHPDYTFELRFPMSKAVLAEDNTDKTMTVNAWGVGEGVTDKYGQPMRPNHKGWNLVGNPYLDYYQKDKVNSFGGLRLGELIGPDSETGYWTQSGTVPYVVVPVEFGWVSYDQVLVSETDLLPFTSYFMQVGNDDTHTNGKSLEMLFDGNNRGRASIARRAPSSVSEQEEPIIVGVSLTNSKGESDKTSLVIDDKYTDEYEMNADFFKWFGDYYRYYTKPVLYTIGADKQQRAFNALNEEQAAKPISMGTYTAQNGEYTFSLDRRSDLSRVKEVWLHDATESAYINLMQEDYSFATGKTDGSGRFTLAVTLHPKSPTDITEGMNGQVYVTSHQRTLYVNNLPQQARVWVYDAVGKLLVNETTNVYQRAYHLGQAGVYFVRVQSQNGCETLQAVVE